MYQREKAGRNLIETDGRIITDPNARIYLLERLKERIKTKKGLVVIFDEKLYKVVTVFHTGEEEHAHYRLL